MNRAKVQVAVPTSYRSHRAVPALYVLHREDLDAADRTMLEGVAVVSMAKAIRQAHGQQLRRSLVEQAIDEADREGWLRRGLAADLRRDLLAGAP